MDLDFLKSKEWQDKKSKCFSTDSHLVEFLQGVLTKDKADRFKWYTGYLQGYSHRADMVSVMSQALVLAGADADDVAKGIADLRNLADSDDI